MVRSPRAHPSRSSACETVANGAVRKSGRFGRWFASPGEPLRPNRLTFFEEPYDDLAACGARQQTSIAALVSPSNHRRLAPTDWRSRQFGQQRLREIKHLIGEPLASVRLVLGQKHAGECPSLGVDTDSGCDRAWLPRSIADTLDLRGNG